MRKRVGILLTVFLTLFGLIVGGTSYAVAAESLEYTYSVSNAEGIVISPDGSTMWVISYYGNSVLKYSTSTHSLLATVATGGVAYQLTMTPDGSKIYVAMSALTKVVAINTSTLATTNITTAATPWGIVATSDGASIWVAETAGRIEKISVANDSVTSTNMGSGATYRDIKVSADGAYLFVGDSTNNQILKINTSNMTVSATLTSVSNYLLAISPDGTIGFVMPGSGTDIYKFNTSNMTSAGTISGFSSPMQAAFTPNGNYLYVANSNGGTISKVKISDSSVTTVITGLSTSTWHLTIDPAGQYLYAGASPATGYVYQILLGPLPALTSLTVASITTYRTSTTLIANFAASGGTVSFLQNGKKIPNCQKMANNSTSVVCNFSPTVHGAIQITVKFLYSGVTTSLQKTLLVVPRVSTR